MTVRTSRDMPAPCLRGAIAEPCVARHPRRQVPDVGLLHPRERLLPRGSWRSADQADVARHRLPAPEERYQDIRGNLGERLHEWSSVLHLLPEAFDGGLTFGARFLPEPEEPWTVVFRPREALEVLLRRKECLDPCLVAAACLLHQWTHFQPVDPRSLGLNGDGFGSKCAVGAVDLGDLRSARVEDRDHDVNPTLVHYGEE